MNITVQESRITNVGAGLQIPLDFQRGEQNPNVNVKFETSHIIGCFVGIDMYAPGSLYVGKTSTITATAIMATNSGFIGTGINIQNHFKSIDMIIEDTNISGFKNPGSYGIAVINSNNFDARIETVTINDCGEHGIYINNSKSTTPEVSLIHTTVTGIANSHGILIIKSPLRELLLHHVKSCNSNTRLYNQLKDISLDVDEITTVITTGSNICDSASKINGDFSFNSDIMSTYCDQGCP